MKKAPTCKECKGKRTITVSGEFISRPVEIECWLCAGTAFKGMSPAQIEWFLAQQKALKTLKAAAFKKEPVIDQKVFSDFKQHVNIAARKLALTVQEFPRQKSQSARISDEVLTLRGELAEYERRLEAIAQKVAA